MIAFKLHLSIPFPRLQELIEEALQRDKEGGDLTASVAALAVWMRFSAARHLTWNRNYNVKPREISAAQVRATLVSGAAPHGCTLRRPLMSLRKPSAHRQN